jgi:hypothetical protein
VRANLPAMSSALPPPDATGIALLALRAGLALVLGAFLALALWVLTRQPPDAPGPPGAELALLDGDGRPGSRYPLRGRGPLCIGRDPNCVVQASDAFVSACHARLEWDAAAGGWWIADNDSRNGTWLNGERVARSPLRDGDMVRVGNSTFLFRVV